MSSATLCLTLYRWAKRFSVKLCSLFRVKTKSKVGVFSRRNLWRWRKPKIAANYCPNYLAHFDRLSGFARKLMNDVCIKQSWQPFLIKHDVLRRRSSRSFQSDQNCSGRFSGWPKFSSKAQVDLLCFCISKGFYFVLKLTELIHLKLAFALVI